MKMNSSRLRIALIAAVMISMSIGFANAACYLNVVQEDSSEFEDYLNVSMNVSTSAPYTAELMITDETQAFFPDAVVDNILLNVPADQIESVTDAEGNEWEVSEATEDAGDFGTFNTSIQPGADIELSQANITINFADTWDQSFPSNDEGYLIATQVNSIGEASDDSAWVTIGFCDEETPIGENGTVTDNETIIDENLTDNGTVIIIDENVTDNDTIIIIDENVTDNGTAVIDDNETVDNETTADENVTTAADCYLNIVQEDKSEYEGQLNASVMNDNVSNTTELNLTNDTLEAFPDAQISTILLNTPVELIENVTDAEGNALEFTEMEASTSDTPFGEFLTIISSLLTGDTDHGFGDFMTEITASETGNLTGPINISYTDEWNGTIPVNEDGYSIAAEVQNIGDAGDDSAWIAVGVCEAANETAQMNIVETAVDAGSFETLVMALEEANLTDTLSGEGPFTVFAPTDEAFDALPEGTLDQLLQDPENLTAVLTYHVVSGEYMSSDIADMDSLPTLQGEDLNITVENDSIMVDNANVTTADVEASNGVIHVIDSVMLPPSMLEDVNETDMNDTEEGIFTTLENEHDAVIALFDEAIESGSRDTFMQIQEELYLHMAAEEEVVYPALQDIEGLDEHAQLAEQEHEEARTLISELEAMDEEDEMWIPTLVELQENIQEHVTHEEEEMFPVAQEQLSTTELQQLDEDYLAAKDTVDMNETMEEGNDTEDMNETTEENGITEVVTT